MGVSAPCVGEPEPQTCPCQQVTQRRRGPPLRFATSPKAGSRLGGASLGLRALLGVGMMTHEETVPARQLQGRGNGEAGVNWMRGLP